MLSSPGMQLARQPLLLPIEHHARARLVDEGALAQAAARPRTPARGGDLTSARPRHPPAGTPGSRARPRSTRSPRHRAAAKRPAPAACRRDLRTGSALGSPSPLLSQAVAIQRTIEPWSALLDEAREDGRLVREAREGLGGLSARPAGGATPRELHPEVLAALSRLEIERLYSHQAEAIYSAWEGPTIVTTGTASGKSMCFNLPTLDVLCRDTQGARALPLPDQGTRPGPGPRAGRLRPDQAGASRDLRRRHPA